MYNTDISLKIIDPTNMFVPQNSSFSVGHEFPTTEPSIFNFTQPRTGIQYHHTYKVIEFQTTFLDKSKLRSLACSKILNWMLGDILMPLNRIEFQFFQICQIAEINTNIQSIHIWYWEWFIQISNNQFGKVLLEFWAVIRILMSSQICLANLHSLSAWLASSSDWRNMVNIQASSTSVMQ